MKRTFELIDDAHEYPSRERALALEGLSPGSPAWGVEDSCARKIMEASSWQSPGGGPTVARYFAFGGGDFRDQLMDFAGAGASISITCLSPPEEWRGHLLLSPAASDAPPTLRLPLYFNRMVLFDTCLLEARLVTEAPVNAAMLSLVVAMQQKALR